MDKITTDKKEEIIIIKLPKGTFDKVKNLSEDNTDFKTTQILYKAIKRGMIIRQHEDYNLLNKEE